MKLRNATLVSILALSPLTLVSFSEAPVSSSAVSSSTEPSNAVSFEGWEDLAIDLEYSPDDAQLLEACGLAALDEGQKDVGAWYLTLALDAAPEDAKLQKRILGQLESNGHPQAEGGQALDSYTQALFRLSKSCASKKLYANAVDLLLRCEGTRYEKAAQERLQKIYGKSKAVHALLASGIAVPMTSKQRKRPGEIARLDKKHADWDKAFELKGKYYRIKTNMGFEMAHAMLNAMEQINFFYRKVFDYKARGGSMRSCSINIYKTRAEFDKFEDVKPTVKGFYSPLDNEVTAYDPRTEERPGTLADLWSTLFHEASHQFTQAVWPNPIPTWLNEGTASFFEGTRIEAGGKVVFNLVPDGRLRNLVILMGRGAPTVEDVITHDKPGSYDGSYYPFGWGLIYFLRNYEDENSERVYLPILADFMASYKSGGKHDLKARFEEYFVDMAKQDEVKTYEQFVARFEMWIKELQRIHNGGEEVADELIARGKKQLADKQPEAARDSFESALRKRPGDPVAIESLAGLFAGLKNKDAALYYYRRLATEARTMAGSDSETAEALLATALAGIQKVDKSIAKNLLVADSTYVETTLALAKQCEEAGLTRSALRFLEQGEMILGGDEQLRALAEELGEGMDLRRYRRIPVEEGLLDWEAGDAWTASPEGMDVSGDGLSIVFCRWETPERFRYEAKIDIHKQEGSVFFGLAFGGNNTTGLRLLAISPGAGKSGIVKFEDGGPKFTRDLDLTQDYSQKSLTLAMELQPGRAEFFLDGESLGTLEGGEELVGRVGLFVQGARATWSEIRIKQ